ncbi:MAG: Uma2 family endonuclease [Anaerolineae bacterium]|nr:Uma2 family endonuclease [Anaerolineae bacterium]
MAPPEATVLAPVTTTADEFEAFIARPENADRRFELINGEIVEKMPTEKHSLVSGNAYFLIRAFVEPRGLGRVAFEVRRRVPEDNRNTFLPDVEFTSASRLQPIVERGPAYQMPDLIIEVQSPDDTIPDMRAKAAYYLQNGATLVWLVLTLKRMVMVLTATTEDILREEDTLDGGDVLPGFILPVKDLFAGT